MTTDPTAAQLVTSVKAKVLLDMRTEDSTRAALGGLYPASSLYMDCAWVAAHKATVQKLANAFVATLRWLKAHSAEETAAKMPAEYAAGGADLYVKSIKDTVGMFNADGRMKPDGARNVLTVLSQFNDSVKAKKDSIDLARTYTTDFLPPARCAPTNSSSAGSVYRGPNPSPRQTPAARRRKGPGVK